MKHIIVCALLGCLLPAAFAEGIYRKDDSGSVELSNLPDEDGYEEVVRAAPAARTPAAVPPAAATAVRPQAAAAAPVVIERGPAAAEVTEEASRQMREPAQPGEGERDAAVADVATAAPAVSGVATISPSSLSAGMSPVSATPPGTVMPVPVGSVSAGDGSQQTPTTPIAQPTPTPIVDSPEQLAARLQNYREMMINESVQAASLPPNPAVVRRYLMTNRSTYMSNHR